jgi:hypothetical protein
MGLHAVPQRVLAILLLCNAAFNVNYCGKAVNYRKANKMAGYSATPLLKKLGIKEAMKVQLVNAPGDYMDLLETDISEQLVSKSSDAELVHIFATSKKELSAIFKQTIKQAGEGLIIWISWYKKSSGMQTDITEDIIRGIVLPTGWVDIKVCAVSELWSGLKIVKRKAV